MLRFLYFYFTEGGAGHIQSLVIGGVFLIIGILTFLFALLADLANFNRQLIEMTLERVRRIELAQEAANITDPMAADHNDRGPAERRAHK